MIMNLLFNKVVKILIIGMYCVVCDVYALYWVFVKYLIQLKFPCDTLNKVRV